MYGGRATDKGEEDKKTRRQEDDKTNNVCGIYIEAVGLEKSSQKCLDILCLCCLCLIK